MRATEILKAEHRVIQQVLSCLEALADDARVRGVLDGPAARDMVDFFRHFADCCHHHKEEACLFPLLELRGFQQDRGPTGVMLAEHEQGRSLVRALEAEIDAAAAGDRQAVTRFAKSAAGYIQLLHEHIFKENQCLFPMANQVLNADDQRRLLDQFASVEHDDMGLGAHERYLQLADKLADRFNIPHVSDQGTSGHACCAHAHA